jgi:hypothetical protein
MCRMSDTSEAPRVSDRPEAPDRDPPVRWANLLVKIVLIVVVGLLILAAVGFVAGWRPSLSNPFSEKTVDRTSPAVLRSLEDLQEYHAASAHFEVVVDLEKDTPYIPSPISGERVLFVGVGKVDAVVDFGRLEEGALTVSEDRLTVEIRLPHPTLSQPTVDPDMSYVVSRQTGAFQRFGQLFGGGGNEDSQQLFKAAADKMSAAAAEDGSVLTLAEQNTTGMLKGFLTALGFTNVTVTFEDNPA